jgi:hypothetical protein
VSENPDQPHALELAKDGQLAAPTPAPISFGAMLQAAFERGVTADNMAAVEKMMDLYERQQAREAEREFAQAFNALQKEIPRVKAVKAVPDKHGNVKYHFAPYEEIDEQVRPFLLKHGFTTSFSMTYSDGRVTQECILQHVGGHVRRNSYTVRIGSGPPGCSDAQADGAAGTYAKRHAYCNALNIIIDHDTDGFDAKKDGPPISPDKAIYLKELVTETKSDEKLFLQYAAAPSYAEIGEARYDDCVRLLTKKKLQAS